MDKSRQIISELQSFFKHNNASKAIKGITTVMDSLTIQSRTVGPVKSPNCKFTFVQAVKLLILFPFFSVKNAAGYADSGLGKLFSCKKDMFYRPMDDGRIDWRRLISSRAKLVYILVRCFDASTSSATLAQQPDLQLIELVEMRKFLHNNFE